MALDKKARLAGIVVEQADEKRFSIRWDAVATDDIIRVFAGDSPATIDKHTPVAETRGGDSVEITLPQPIDNPYFEIVKDGGKGLVWALRQLPLEKTCNFRDIGGYRTKDNRRMRWGQVFRSPHLAMLTDNDHNLMHRIGIKLVCDFRTREEAEAQPDRLPKDGSMEYLSLPIFHGKYDPAEAFECIKQGDISWLTDDFMTNNYLKQIDDFAHLWKQFFEHLMDSKKRPLVFHCTAGKDRTGVCAALILLTAGVPESTVIADHALSNKYNAHVIEHIKLEIKKFGIDPEDMRSYLTAPREAMQAVLKHLREEYGSATEYLTREAGIGPQDLERLKREITVGS